MIKQNFLTEILDKSTRSSQPVSLELDICVALLFYASPSFQCMKSPYNFAMRQVSIPTLLIKIEQMSAIIKICSFNYLYARI